MRPETNTYPQVLRFSLTFQLLVTAAWVWAALHGFGLLEMRDPVKGNVLAVFVVLAIPFLWATWFSYHVIDEEGIIDKSRPGRRLLPHRVRWGEPVQAYVFEQFGARTLALSNGSNGDRGTVYIPSNMRPLQPLLRVAQQHAASFDADSLRVVKEFVEGQQRPPRPGLRVRLRARFKKWWKRTRWAWFGR